MLFSEFFKDSDFAKAGPREGGEEALRTAGNTVQPCYVSYEPANSFSHLNKTFDKEGLCRSAERTIQAALAA